MSAGLPPGASGAAAEKSADEMAGTKLSTGGGLVAAGITIAPPISVGRCSRNATPPATIRTRIRAAISLELLRIRLTPDRRGLPLDRPPPVSHKPGGGSGDDHSGDGQET